MVKISIVIPTLNEEEYLPKLLESIKKQTFKDYEIIVADAVSKDDTISIAKKYGAIVVKGGMPAVGRNAGAKIAKGEFLYFFDADVKLPQDFLEKTYNEIQKNYIDLATTELRPLSNLALDKMLHGFVNVYMRLNQLSNPHAPGFCILISQRLFKRIKGFNERLTLCEDHDLVRRASKFRPLKILNSTKYYVSVRRLRKEGRLCLTGKYMKTEFFFILKKDITKKIMDYEFGKFKDKTENYEKLKKLEQQLNKIDQDYKKFARKYLNGEKLSRNYELQIMNIKKEFNKDIDIVKKLLKIKDKIKK